MSRKLRPLTSEDYARLPAGCVGCIFWESEQHAERTCGSVCDIEAQLAWHHLVVQEWGDCGRVALDDGEIIGFVKYAPSGYFPQARTFPSAPLDPAVSLIACLHV